MQVFIVRQLKTPFLLTVGRPKNQDSLVKRAKRFVKLTPAHDPLDAQVRQLRAKIECSPDKVHERTRQGLGCESVTKNPVNRTVTEFCRLFFSKNN